VSGAQETAAGCEIGKVTGLLGAQMALQLIESLGDLGLEFGDTDRMARSGHAVDCPSGNTQETRSGGFGRLRRDDGPQDQGNAGCEHRGNRGAVEDAGAGMAGSGWKPTIAAFGRSGSSAPKPVILAT
jgi:hypothetical protein